MLSTASRTPSAVARTFTTAPASSLTVARWVSTASLRFWTVGRTFATVPASSLTVARWVSTVLRRLSIDLFANSIWTLILPRSSARFEIQLLPGSQRRNASRCAVPSVSTASRFPLCRRADLRPVRRDRRQPFLVASRRRAVRDMDRSQGAPGRPQPGLPPPTPPAQAAATAHHRPAGRPPTPPPGRPRPARSPAPPTLTVRKASHPRRLKAHRIGRAERRPDRRTGIARLDLPPLAAREPRATPARHRALDQRIPEAPGGNRPAIRRCRRIDQHRQWIVSGAGGAAAATSSVDSLSAIRQSSAARPAASASRPASAGDIPSGTGCWPKGLRGAPAAACRAPRGPLAIRLSALREHLTGARRTSNKLPSVTRPGRGPAPVSGRLLVNRPGPELRPSPLNRPESNRPGVIRGQLVEGRRCTPAPRGEVCALPWRRRG